MKVEINKLPKSEVELKIEVPAQEWQEFLNEAVKELSKELKIEGFRPGFAPFKMVEEKIGLSKILEEAAERCIRKCYVRAILENKIEAIGQPEISVMKLARGNPFEFKAKASVMPEINLPDYRKIASGVKKEKVSIEEKDINETLLLLQKSRPKFTPKPSPCQKGDWLEVEYWSPQIDEGKKTSDSFILGEGRFVSGFEQNLEGMEAGQEKEFCLTFPKDHLPKDLAGKEINFVAKLKSVQKVEFPEIDDQFAKNLGHFENLPDLKKSLKENIIREKEREESQRVRQVILEKITKNLKLEIPEILIKKETTYMLEDLKQNVSQKLGTNFTDYLNKIKKTEEDLLSSFLPAAKRKIENLLVLREISKRENIEVSEEEVKNEINKVLKNYSGAPKLDPEKLKYYTEDVLINEKTLQVLEGLTK